MFGAFKPSAALSGGLLWKIPWRLSRPQKLRHRRRLRRVDNVVAVLDSALQRQALSSFRQSPILTASTPANLPNDPQTQKDASSKASPEELSLTAEGRGILQSESHGDREARPHGRGPRQGEMVPEVTSRGLRPSNIRLGDEARATGTVKLIERWKAEMPTEQEMLPRDKYSMFDRKARGYRKGVHKLPKWTRVSQRLNPPGY